MNNKKLGKRIIIIGSCGSGKSTLAVKLNKITNIPVIHLDKEYWNPGWKETPQEQWHEKQYQLLGKSDCWIADGNFQGSLDIRLNMTDTVIFLDYNRYICLYRAFKRWLTNYGKTRKDMADGCIEKMDIAFFKYIWRFPLDSRYKIINKLKEYHNVNKIILKNPKETEKFINGFKSI